MNGKGSAPRADRASDVFPTLDADLSDEFPERSGTAKRICIATADLLGPVKNGGIGTAYHHLARSLIEWGHEVVIAYVNGNAADARLMEETRAFYAGFGVAFEPNVPRPASGTALARVSAPTWALLDWLRTRERTFDLLHVSDWRGLGYGPLLAKSHGLAFGATHIVVHGHGPTLWNVEGNQQLLSTELELGWVFMERRSVELADTVTCGSAHLLDWMRDAGYVMPARSFVWPNPFPAPESTRAVTAARAALNGVALKEVVFFGRLEPRKGLVVFVDAIDQLVRQGRAPACVTFLGGLTKRFGGPEFIRNSTRAWPVEVNMITDFGAEEAVTYLSQPGRLAVLPSLQENSSLAITECLHAGIPFVAAATGGTPELIAPEDRARTLAAPDHIALAERIAEVAGAPLRAVCPRWDFEHALEVWSRWHAQTTSFAVTAARFAEKEHIVGAETPLVTICIVHHERPELVHMAVGSVLDQDYPALDVVLVDDGSESAEALEALDAIETEFAGRGWRVSRQENRFKGAARNAAASAARGDWLLFLDDDNVLFPDAVSRLLRAARFSGADCLPAASMRFSGNGDPRTDTESHDAPIRFLGAARAWSRFNNVVGDTCALVRREAFEAVGGFDDEFRVGLEDLSFLNRLIQAGYRIEPMPDPVYYYRFGNTSTKRLNRSAEAAQVRILAPHVKGLPDEERAYAAYTAACIRDRNGTGSHYHHQAKLAMRRGDWERACTRWAELRHTFPEHAAGFVHGAEALMNAGHLEEAETVADEAVERFPDQAGGHVQRGEIAMRRRDWEGACARWAELRHAFPEHAAGFVRGAEALMNAGHLEEAETVAGEAVAQFPDRSHGHYHRGQIAMRLGDWEGACAPWAEMRHAFPDQAAGFVRGAEALMNAGHLEEAEAVAGEAVTRFPDQAGGHVQRGEIAMRRRNWEGACTRWAEMRHAFPEHTAGFVRGAEALMNAGHLEEAEMVAGEAVAQFPDRSDGHYHRAEIAMRRREWEGACTRWAEMRRAFPDQAAGFVRGAEALMNAGHLEEAEAVAGEAVARFPDRSDGHYHRGQIAMRRRDWEGACARWAELRHAFPDQAAGFARGAEALMNAGHLEEAEAVAGEAVARFPDRAGGHVQRGEIAMRRRDWEGACARWAELRRAFPDQAAGFVRGAEALMNAGHLEEAEAVAGEAVARFPDRSDGHYHRGQIAMRRRDWEGACARWAELRHAFPDQAAGFARGAEALMNAGHLEEAEAVAGEAVARFPDRAGGHVQRGEIAMRRRDWEGACARWAELRHAFPEHAAGFVRGAEALMNAGHLEEAETVAGEAVARFPDRAGGHVHRGEIAMRRGDWEGACTQWTEVRHAFPDQAAGFVRGAEALMNAGHLEEAEAVAGEAVTRFPDQAGGHVQRGEIAMRRRNWEGACTRWAEMRHAFPEHTAGFVRGAEALMNAGHLEEAETVAGEAVARFPDRAGGHVQRGEIAMRRRDWEGACARWAEFRHAFPDQAAGFVRGAALARWRPCFETENLEISILIDPKGVNRAEQLHDREPFLDVRCNGRVVAQASVQDLSHGLVRITVEPSIPTADDTLFSIHDAVTDKTLATLITPPFCRAQRIVGAVENRPRPEVRGWTLDLDHPERSRMVAIHVDGRLVEVVSADRQRSDIARWQETDGCHGFLWRIPESLSVMDGTHIDVFDADTGLPLRSSPARLKGGQVVVSGRNGT